MPEWLIERGIGETRYALVENGEIAEARVLLDGVVPAGMTLHARLKRTGAPAIAESRGVEYLLPKGGSGATEGAALTIEVTREAIPGAEPWKRPLARVAEGAEQTAELPAGETLPLPAPEDRLDGAGWSDLVEEARAAIVRFRGGELRVSVTPAMTLIDVDGVLPLPDLGLAAAEAAARTIRRHGIGGSIGIDFPTLTGKAVRQAIADVLDRLVPQPFERTSLNGFGFLQIVRPRRHASLFELAQDRAPFEARALLRRSAFEQPGPKRLAAHPAIVATLKQKPDWIEALSRQLGASVGLRADPALPMSGGYAEPA